jgi:hypothetical protein
MLQPGTYVGTPPPNGTPVPLRCSQPYGPANRWTVVNDACPQACAGSEGQPVVIDDSQGAPRFQCTACQGPFGRGITDTHRIMLVTLPLQIGGPAPNWAEWVAYRQTATGLAPLAPGNYLVEIHVPWEVENLGNPRASHAAKYHINRRNVVVSQWDLARYGAQDRYNSRTGWVDLGVHSFTQIPRVRVYSVNGVDACQVGCDCYTTVCDRQVRVDAVRFTPVCGEFKGGPIPGLTPTATPIG